MIKKNLININIKNDIEHKVKKTKLSHDDIFQIALYFRSFQNWVPL